MNDKEQIIDNINTFYKVFSGSKSSIREWDKLKDLFYENATLCSYKQIDNQSHSKILSVDEYISRLMGFLEYNDFYEYSTKNEVIIKGNVCSVLNEYEAFKDPSRSVLIKKGTNLITMLKDGNYWKIVNMLWEDK